MGLMPTTRTFAADPRVDDRLRHPDLAAQVRRRLPAAVPGDHRRRWTDGNPATAAEAGWTPLVIARAQLRRLRQRARLPDVAPDRRDPCGARARTPRSSCAPPTAPPRVYTKLAALEHDAFYARIWSGLHFADAMDDGYLIGHDTAARVMAALPSR